MKRTTIITISLVAAVLVGVAVYRNIATLTQQEEVVSPEVVKAGEQPTVDVKLPPPPASVQTLEEPPVLKGFKGWDTRDRLNKVTELMESKRLDPRVIAYMKLAIQDWTLDNVVRNNMANCLCKQEKADRQLYKLFMDTYDNPGENHEFKDFSIQFMARTHSFADKPGLVLKKLTGIATNEPSRLAGTAMIQLAYLEQMGETVLSSEILDTMKKRLVDSDQPVPVRMAAMGIIGKRKDKVDLPLVRELVKSDDLDDDVRRVSIATLGQIGEKTDLPEVKHWLCHANRLVVKAAEGALKRLAPKEFDEILEEVYAAREASTPAETVVRIDRSKPDTGNAGLLSFDISHRTLKAKGTGDTVKASFSFKNTGRQSIKIVSIQTSCGCTTTALKKKEYAPGESGVFQALLNTRGRQGTQTKVLTVRTNESDSRPYRLSITAKIPELIRCTPRTLMWAKGEPITRKRILLEAAGNEKVKPVKVILTNDRNFNVETTCIKPDKSYEIWVTPKSTALVSATTVKIRTNFPRGFPLTFRSRARIK